MYKDLRANAFHFVVFLIPFVRQKYIYFKPLRGVLFLLAYQLCKYNVAQFLFCWSNFGSGDGTGNYRFVIMEFETEYWRRSPLILISHSDSCRCSNRVLKLFSMSSVTNRGLSSSFVAPINCSK